MNTRITESMANDVFSKVDYVKFATRQIMLI